MAEPTDHPPWAARFVTEGIAQAKAEGRAEERAAIVAWLRRQVVMPINERQVGMEEAYTEAADAIESGYHLTCEPPTGC